MSVLGKSFKNGGFRKPCLAQNMIFIIELFAATVAWKLIRNFGYLGGFAERVRT
jgi:hypothetical protein